MDSSHRVAYIDGKTLMEKIVMPAEFIIEDLYRKRTSYSGRCAKGRKVMDGALVLSSDCQGRTYLGDASKTGRGFISGIGRP